MKRGSSATIKQEKRTENKVFKQGIKLLTIFFKKTDSVVYSKKINK